MGDLFPRWQLSLDEVVADRVGRHFSFHGCTQVAYIVTAGVGLSAGAVNITMSDDPDYAGAWAIIDTIPFTAANGKVSGTYPGPVAHIRAEAVGVADGSLSVAFQGLQGAT